jgi:hypothetical protein
MGSVPKRRCARGQNCYHVRVFGLSEAVELRSSSKSDFCDRCLQEHAGGLHAPRKGGWEDEVIEAIEALYASRPTPQRPGKASLWDLFDLDPDNGGQGQHSDRGEVLTRLSAKTLAKLADWISKNAEEALAHSGKQHLGGLYQDVRILARLMALPPGEPRLPNERDPSLLLEARGYTRGGRGVDHTVVIRLARLRRARRYFSERDYKKILGVPRSTIRDMIKRMDEIGFSLEKFTPGDLGYVARGPRRNQQKKTRSNSRYYLGEK